MRIDYPKFTIRVPSRGVAEKAPALSIAASAYIAAENLERAQERDGEIRVRIFEAVAKAYYALPRSGAAGLDLKLLEERIAAEVGQVSGASAVRIVFREFSVR